MIQMTINKVKTEIGMKNINNAKSYQGQILGQEFKDQGQYREFMMNLSNVQSHA